MGILILGKNERIEFSGDDHFVSITEDQLEAVELRVEINALKAAIRSANECSDSYEGVGLLYWMDQCGDSDTEEYKTIEEILH